MVKDQVKNSLLRKRLSKIIGKSYVLLILAVLYLPIIFILVYSFSSGRGFGEFNFSMENITGLFNPADRDTTRMLTALGNTLWVGAVSALLATVLGTLAAVGINSMKRKGKTLLLTSSNIPMYNADIIIAISLMIFFVLLDLQKGAFTVIISYVVITSPYVILNVLPRLKQMNMSVYDAALDLGATPVKALFKIIIPEILPGIISGFVLAFTLAIDDFVIAQFTRGTTFETFSTYVYSQAAGKSGLSGTLKPLSSLLFLTVLIILVVYNIYVTRKNKGKDEKVSIGWF